MPDEPEGGKEQMVLDTPPSIIDGDGKLSEDWRNSVPEEFRNEDCLKTVHDWPGFISQFVHAQKSIGKNKVALPGEKATERELQAFYDAIGRPKTPDDYPYERDPDVPEDLYSDDRIARARKVAHEIGLTPKQFARLVKWDNDELKLAMAESETSDERETADVEGLLKQKWGMAYEERIHAINVLVNQTTEEGEQRDEFVAKYGRDPVFLEWAQGVAKNFVESKALIVELTQATPKEALAQISELTNTPGYLDGRLNETDPAKHKKIVSELERLYKIAYPEKGGGR